ncbi:hypothetical protein ACTFIZ_012873 [Dictyostelium cf. discoideum]
MKAFSRLIFSLVLIINKAERKTTGDCSGSVITKKPGDNPHLWYDPVAMPVMTRTIAHALQTIDPDNKEAYQQAQEKMQLSFEPMQNKIKALHQFTNWSGAIRWSVLGRVDEVINSDVLSRLYGSLIEVVHLNGRIFVMSGAIDVEKDEHAHHA